MFGTTVTGITTRAKDRVERLYGYVNSTVAGLTGRVGSLEDWKAWIQGDTRGKLLYLTSRLEALSQHLNTVEKKCDDVADSKDATESLEAIRKMVDERMTQMEQQMVAIGNKVESVEKRVALIEQCVVELQQVVQQQLS